MTFRELLKLYKKGELTDKEKPMVESEIDKFEALSDYVFSDVQDESTLESGSDTDQNPNPQQETPDEAAFTKTIKKQIHNAFVRMGIIILAVLIVFVLFFQFALSPIVDSFYYDPAKETTIKPFSNDDGFYKVQQMEKDFQVFADLNMPMENRTHVQATPLGYGKYNLSVIAEGQSSYDEAKPSISGQLVRDRLTFSIPDFIDSDLSYTNFAYLDNSSVVIETKEGPYTVPKDREYAKEMRYFVNDELKDYGDDEMLKVAISFKDPITFTNMNKLIDKYDIEQVWYAVATSRQNGEQQRDLGFSLAYGSWFYGYEDPEYPNLFYQPDKDDTAVKQHFMSMLKYMSDQKEFLSILNGPEYGTNEYYADMYSNAYKYVEKNDFKLYGCVAFVQKKSLVDMIENKDAHLVRFYDSGQ